MLNIAVCMSKVSCAGGSLSLHLNTLDSLSLTDCFCCCSGFRFSVNNTLLWSFSGVRLLVALLYPVVFSYTWWSSAFLHLSLQEDTFLFLSNLPSSGVIVLKSDACIYLSCIIDYRCFYFSFRLCVFARLSASSDPNASYFVQWWGRGLIETSSPSVRDITQNALRLSDCF